MIEMAGPWRAVMRCIRRGTVVYKEGDAPDYFHLIFSGAVDMTRTESLSKPTRWGGARRTRVDP